MFHGEDFDDIDVDVDIKLTGRDKDQVASESIADDDASEEDYLQDDLPIDEEDEDDESGMISDNYDNFDKTDKMASPIITEPEDI